MTIRDLPDINEFARLLSIHVSCEYSESVYSLLKIIQNFSKKHLKKQCLEKKFLENRDNLLKPLHKALSPVLLTLVGLLKYTKHFASKYHEIMTILLSWYTYITDFVVKVENNSTIAQRLESLELTSNQVEFYLKDFITNNCRRFNDFILDQELVEDQLKDDSFNGENSMYDFKIELDWLRKLSYS